MWDKVDYLPISKPNKNLLFWILRNSALIYADFVSQISADPAFS